MRRAERHPRERGIAMLLVMIAVAVAAVLSLTFVSRQATSAGVRENIDHHEQARAIAEAAVDVAVAEMKTNNGWRSAFTHNQWSTSKALSNGTYRLRFYDTADGVLANKSLDGLTLTAEGVFGGVAHQANANIVPLAILGDLLMIHASPSDGGMSQGDKLLQAQFESWGWLVTTMADNVATATMRTAAEDADAVYVSTSANSSNVTSKLSTVTTGCVTHEANLAHQWGLVPANTSSTYVTTSTIRVVNATHYITKTLSAGNVSILNQSQSIRYLNAQAASSATLLANYNGDVTKPYVVTLEKGAAMAGGSTSPGRRVCLPWGQSADPSWFSDNGRTLVKRSLEWAAMDPPAAPGPIAHWKLDETSGTAATDTMALAHGAHKNGPVVNQTGKLTKAVKFDGTNDYAEAPHRAAFLMNEGSVAFWFKLDTTAKRHELFSKDGAGFGSGGHFSIWANGAGLYARLEDLSTTYQVSKTSALTANTWYHAVVTFGPTGLRLYLDGVNVASHLYAGGLGTSSGGSGNAQPIVLGANTAASPSGSATGLTDFLQGYLDDVRIYERALATNEISQLASGAETITASDTATYGLIGKDSITLGHDSVVDSYDSSAGAYSAATNSGSAATLATNATASAKVLLQDRANVKGNISVGVGGTPATVISKVNGATYTSAASLLSAVTVPATTAPSGGTPVPYANLNNGSMTFPAPGTYTFSGNLTANNYVFYITKPVAVVLGGNTTFNNVTVVITGDGSVTFYGVGSVNFGNDSKINVTATGSSPPAGDPSLFKLYKIGAGSVSFGDRALFSGQFYGSEASLTAGNDGNLYGILQAKTISLGHRTKFHHDLHIELNPEVLPASTTFRYLLRWTDQR